MAKAIAGLSNLPQTGPVYRTLFDENDERKVRHGTMGMVCAEPERPVNALKLVHWSTEHGMLRYRGADPQAKRNLPRLRRADVQWRRGRMLSVQSPRVQDLRGAALRWILLTPNPPTSGEG